MERNLSIELLKFIAVIVVVNSHSDIMWGEYSYLATGGAIGDSLFFFASGFTIFLGRTARFDNWYKRRIRRIYPSLIALALILPLFGSKPMDIVKLVFGAGAWFISCIMIYYIFLYAIKIYFEKKPVIPFVLCSITVVIWYLFEDRSKFFMYGDTWFKWLHFFLFMLLGAYIGNGTLKVKPNILWDSINLIGSVILFYAMSYFATKMNFFSQLQILTLIPLGGVIWYIYKLCSHPKANGMMMTHIGLCIRFIAGLCLEIYIVQAAFFTDKLNSLFPFNLLIVFLEIVAVAYMLRCLAKIILQIFQKEDFDWEEIFRPIL